MDGKVINSRLLSVDDLKTNLRLADDDTFDAELRMKLSASVIAAGKFIGRDLSTIDTFSCPFAARIDWELPSVYHIFTVAVGNVVLPPEDWAYADGKLFIYREDASFAGQTVHVNVHYNDDIKIAALMMASYLFENPVDSVETLPKASQNMLRHYRYGQKDR